MSDQNLQLIDFGPMPAYTLNDKHGVVDPQKTICLKIIVDHQKIQLDYKANDKGGADPSGSHIVSGNFDYYKPLCFIVEGNKDSPAPTILNLAAIEDILQKKNHPTPIYFSEVIDNNIGHGSDFLTPKPRSNGKIYIPYVGYITSNKRVDLSLKVGDEEDTTSLSIKDYKQKFIRYLRDIKTNERTEEVNIQGVLNFTKKNYNASKLAIGCYGGSFLTPESMVVPILYVTPQK